MPEPTTISFVGTTEIKRMLEEWAAADDRSVSYIMRQILAKEAQRRQGQINQTISSKEGEKINGLQ